MATPFQCPCGRALVADDAHRGLEVKCPSCGRTLLVPAVPGATAQEAGPATVAPAAQGGPAAFSSPSAPAPASGAARACPHCGAGIPAWGERCLKCGAFVEGSGPAPTIRICPKCGAQVPSASAACGHCGAPMDAGAPGSPQRSGLPWEHRETLGVWPAAFQTIKMVLLEPATAFSTMKLPPSVSESFIFLVIFGCGGAVIGALWNLAFRGMLASFMPTPRGPAGPFPPRLFELLQGVLGVFLAPFLQAIGWIVGAGLFHLGLLMTGAARRDFNATLAAYAYVLGAVGVLQLFPICGAVVGGIWALICLVIALIHVHGCPTWKAIVAVIWPVVLCCCCGVGAAVLVPALVKK